MKKNKILNIVGIIIMSLLIIFGAIGTSIYSKKNTPSEKSKFNFYFDMSNWNYDEKNNVYYQINVNYCEKSKINENQKFDIYVPGEYLTGKKNNNEKYKCDVNDNGQKAGYNAKSAPMIISIQSEESIEQKTHKKYDFEEISNYINEGYIYIWPGTRGLKENQKNASNEEYSNAIIDGVTDLKALVRFCRFNKGIMPGDVEKIIAFGENGGGTKSAIIGASGDSELYLSKLLNIGAIMASDDGLGISDSVNGTMCCSPTINLEIAQNAYAWSIGQYLDNNNTEKQKTNNELALQYANFVNKMKFKSEDGTLLYLDETKQGVYTIGTYSNYMLTEIEKSINNFLQNITFPYVNSEKNTTYSTARDYVESLNLNGKWIMYDDNTNSVKINSFKDFANFYKDKNIQVDSKISLNEYNPYYFLSDKYSGFDSSYISRNWNICTLIDEKYNNFLPEENLKLILQKNEDVRKVKYSCIWTKDFSDKEKNQIVFDNLKSWVKSSY